MILGAVLAGGQARRFGSDKALVEIGGRAMIDLVIDLLGKRVDNMVICGRVHRHFIAVADRPATGLGPLGGLNAALHYAKNNGFETVLTFPCDTPFIADELIADLVSHREMAVVAGCPVIGVWSAALSDRLDAYLITARDRSMNGWADHVGACRIHRPAPVNVNRPADLAAAVRPDGGSGNR